MKRTVLVIEDDQPLMKAITDKLEQEGFLTVTSKTVAHAVEILQSTAGISAIWLDHYLIGNQSGIDFLITMRSLAHPLCDIPVYVVSNSIGSDKVATYKGIGINRYFVKAESTLKEIIGAIRADIESTT
jgi:CheY-like chemotaxis protein